MGECFGKHSDLQSFKEVPFQLVHLPEAVKWMDVDTDSDDEPMERYEIEELRSAMDDFKGFQSYPP